MTSYSISVGRDTEGWVRLWQMKLEVEMIPSRKRNVNKHGKKTGREAKLSSKPECKCLKGILFLARESLGVIKANSALQA